jgi:hypothetical protein
MVGDLQTCTPRGHYQEPRSRAAHCATRNCFFGPSIEGPNYLSVNSPLAPSVRRVGGGEVPISLDDVRSPCGKSSEKFGTFRTAPPYCLGIPSPSREPEFWCLGLQRKPRKLGLPRVKPYRLYPGKDEPTPQCGGQLGPPLTYSKRRLSDAESALTHTSRTQLACIC